MLIAASSGWITISCGGSPDTGQDQQVWSPQQRFFTDPADLLPGQRPHQPTEEQFRWSFSEKSELERWTQEGADRSFEIDHDILTLASSRQYMKLIRKVDLQAEAIDFIQIILDETVGGSQYWFHWSGPEQAFSADREIHIPPLSQLTPKEVNLELARHPLWQGAISRVQLTLGVGHGRTLRLRSVVGLADSIKKNGPAAEPLARLATLNHEMRSAIEVSPDKPISWTVEVPPDARLKIGYGLPPKASTQVELAVVAESPPADTRILFSRAAASSDLDRWTDETLDLSQFAGQKIELRFGISSHQLDSSGARPSVLWANPEILIATPAPPPNLVVVIVDTLRADRLSLYGNPRKTSPALDEWAEKNGVVFDQVVAAAPWTLPSHVSIFSGLDSHRHGANHEGPAADSIQMLAETLRQAGYATLAVTGGGFLHPRFGLFQGFDRYRSWPRGILTETQYELEANMQAALDLVDEYQQQPFFLFLHTYEVHEPYLPRSPFYESFTARHDAPAVKLDHHLENGVDVGFVSRRRLGVVNEDEPATWTTLPPDQAELPFDLYDSAIAYTDRWLQQLWTRLQNLPESRPTLIVFTSDHGEMLGEHGLGGHSSLFDEALLVPLVVALPGGEHSGTRVRKPVRSIDLLPTILDILDLPAPGDIDGVSLTPLMAGSTAAEQIATEVAWSYAPKPNLGLTVRRGGDFKFFLNHTVWEPALGTTQLFEISADPNEDHDLSADLPSKTKALLQMATERLSRELPGLRIRLRNNGPDSVFGELEGKPFRPARVKSLDLTCPCIQWQADDLLSFEIPAGLEYTLILEEASAEPIVVRLTEPGDPEFRIHLGELEGTQSLARTTSGWSLDSRDTESRAAAISIWWQGDRVQAQEEIAPELQEQLKALGYVN